MSRRQNGPTFNRTMRPRAGDTQSAADYQWLRYRQIEEARNNAREAARGDDQAAALAAALEAARAEKG